MSNLYRQLDSFEREQVAKVLEKLFIYQDRKVDKDKIALLVERIAYWPYPLEAIVSGITSLAESDIRTLKLSIIREAVRERTVPEKEIENSYDCVCRGSGIMSMVTSSGYSCAFGCKCLKGSEESEKYKMQQWNGRISQTVRGVEYKVWNWECLNQRDNPSYFQD